VDCDIDYKKFCFVYNEFLYWKDKEIAEKLIAKVRKKKKNKQYTKSYKILADILGISLE